MIVGITKYDLTHLEREYENAILGSIDDGDDVFVPIRDVGLCVIKKNKCRKIIDEANRQFNNGKRFVEIKVDLY